MVAEEKELAHHTFITWWTRFYSPVFFVVPTTCLKKRETKTEVHHVLNACCAIFFCTCGSFGLQNIFQARKRQLVSHCESSKFVLSFFLFCVLFFRLVMTNNFLWLLSVEVHFNKLKIFLLYFQDTYGVNL